MKVLAFFMILLALALAACTAPAPALVPTATPQPIPTQAPATATTAPSPSLAPISPTLQSSTAAPSTLTPASAPTEPSGGATFPPSTLPAALGPTPVGGLCSNAFHPVTATARWQYRAVGFSNTAPLTYTVTLGNITPSSFVEHYAVDSTTLDVPWQCSSDGLRAAPLANLFISGQTPFQFQTVNSSGVTLAPSDQWTTGANWSSSYAVQGQAALNAVTVAGSGNVNIRDQVMDLEAVTVPAGTFQAFRVDSTINISLTGTSAGTSVPVVVTLKRSSWYVMNVGLVRMILNFDSQSATTELLAFTP